MNTTAKRYQVAKHVTAVQTIETSKDLILRVRQNNTLNRKIKIRLEARNPITFISHAYRMNSARLPVSMKKSADGIKNLKFLLNKGCPVRMLNTTFLTAMHTARKTRKPTTIFGKNKCDVEYCILSFKNESIITPVYGF